MNNTLPILTIATDRCRRCFSCVRGCPAKAICVREGQAQVIAERCVGCGRCVLICSQGVKRIVDNLPAVKSLLGEKKPVIILAPSFAAAFLKARPGQIIAALRRCGFVSVYEVAFGAELVSNLYQKLYNEDPVRMLISTPCPVAVQYIGKYAVNLLPYLSPVLSPMAAMGKALKSRLLPGCHVVFAGPCTAKIREIQEPDVRPWVDAVLTFSEVEELIRQSGIDPARLNNEEFDPPHSRLGGLFPMQGGLIRVASLPTDLYQNSVHHVAGRAEFSDLIEKLNYRIQTNRLHELETRFFDVMFCEGCIDGPVMPEVESRLRRKERIVEYMRSRQPLPVSTWESAMEFLKDLDFSRTFKADPQTHEIPSEEKIREVLVQTNKLNKEQELNCGACGYKSCREKAIAVWNGLAEVEMCLPYMIEKLEATVKSLNLSYDKLTETQTQLLRSERLASMGQMAAGIAHEVNNPLGTILIYAYLLREHPMWSEAVSADIDMIIQEAIRCKNIVGGLLNFARQTKLMLEPVQLGDLLQKAAEATRAQSRDCPIEIVVNTPPNLPLAYVDKDQMFQVILNLMRNAVEAMPDGGKVTSDAEWRNDNREFIINIRDQGTGIAPENLEKLFSPFFSTKPVGKGTGLGLAICYGIVKMHCGQIRSRNNPDGPGATFEISFPSNGTTEEKM
ncbi:MAG: histidine kinase [Candidatus Riflebacteria bacterium]|nr:histidine kinase [Candidatus Riflebacteria bacterium]